MTPEIRNLGRISYGEALAIQNALVDQLLAHHPPETILLVEHEPVYTIGRTRDQSSLRAASFLPHPVVETNRGGQATYHGPGQLVGYPILDLTPRGRDLHAYLRSLESLLIDLCAAFGVPARRRESLTGVWVDDRKIASLGVGVRKWISMHGFAINITPESLPPFSAITPCGIANVKMTSLTSEAGRTISVEQAREALRPLIAKHLHRPAGPASAKPCAPPAS